MADWQTKSSKIVYETAWFKIYRDEVLNHLSKPLTYSYVKLQHPSAFIVPVNPKGKILLQRAYRYTIDKTIWEIPAGHSDGEDLLSAAKRELLEETGFTSDDWVDMGTQNQAVGIGNVPCNMFLARNIQPAATEGKEEVEDISDHTFFAPSEIDAMIKAGDIDDAPVVVALYLAKLYGF